MVRGHMERGHPHLTRSLRFPLHHLPPLRRPHHVLSIIRKHRQQILFPSGEKNGPPSYPSACTISCCCPVCTSNTQISASSFPRVGSLRTCEYRMNRPSLEKEHSAS